MVAAVAFPYMCLAPEHINQDRGLGGCSQQQPSSVFPAPCAGKRLPVTLWQSAWVEQRGAWWDRSDRTVSQLTWCSLSNLTMWACTTSSVRADPRTYISPTQNPISSPMFYSLQHNYPQGKVYTGYSKQQDKVAVWKKLYKEGMLILLLSRTPWNLFEYFHLIKGLRM